MKKILLYLMSLFGSVSFILAAEITSEVVDKKYKYAGMSVDTGVVENPYSVEKQYSKAAQIKKANKFYNFKKNNGDVITEPIEERFYSLVDIYNLAIKNNAEYHAAKLVFVAKVETVPKALGELLPKIDFQYNLDNQFGMQARIISNKLNFTGSQVLFDWTKWKTFTQATYLQKSYAMIYAKAEQTLIVNTITAYFELLKTEQALQFQVASEAWNKKLYTTQQHQYNAGIVSYADFKTTDSQYRQAVADKIDAQKNFILAKANMAKLTGKEISSVLHIAKADKFGSPVPNDIDYWLETADKHNLDIVQKEFEYKASKEGVGIKWGNFFPSVSLTGGMLISKNRSLGSSQKNPIPTTHNEANISGNVNWNILRGGSDFAQLKQSGYDRQAANYSLLQTKREVYASVVESFQTVALDSIRIEAFKKSVHSGLASVKAILEGFNAGTQTIVDLLNRQAVLVQAQLSFANSIFNYIKNYIQLKQSQGSLNYKDVEYINSFLGKTNIISKIAID